MLASLAYQSQRTPEVNVNIEAQFIITIRVNSVHWHTLVLDSDIIDHFSDYLDIRYNNKYNIKNNKVK